METSYLHEFLTIVVVHLLAVASPGPDFAMVVRQSLAHGRRTAIWTSLGIGSGILVHISYSLLGIGLIISRSILAFNLLKLAGAAYLVYVGWKSLRARAAEVQQPTAAPAAATPPARRAFTLGFLTNALNPKATLFFFSLFTVVISPTTPLAVQAGYGLWMILATAAWFSTLALLLTQSRVRRTFHRFGHWAERGMGAVLIALGLKLALTRAQ